MENALTLLVGFLVGYIVGVLRGRHSIVKEAQELVSNAILEVRKHAR